MCNVTETYFGGCKHKCWSVAECEQSKSLPPEHMCESEQQTGKRDDGKCEACRELEPITQDTMGKAVKARRQVVIRAKMVQRMLSIMRSESHGGSESGAGVSIELDESENGIASVDGTQRRGVEERSDSQILKALERKMESRAEELQALNRNIRILARMVFELQKHCGMMQG